MSGSLRSQECIPASRRECLLGADIPVLRIPRGGTTFPSHATPLCARYVFEVPVRPSHHCLLLLDFFAARAIMPDYTRLIEGAFTQ